MNKTFSLIFGLLLMAATLSAAPVKYKVVGKNLKVYEGVMFRIQPMSMEEVPVLDSAVVRDGSFSMEGTVEAPLVCNIVSADRRHPLSSLIVVGDDRSLLVTPTDRGLLVRGGSRQELFGTYERELSGYVAVSGEQRNRMLSEYYDSATTDARKAAIRKAFEDIETREHDFTKRFVLSHCDNVVGSYYFARSYTYFSPEEIETLRKHMKPEFAENELAAATLAILKASEKRSPGTLYTDFSQPDSLGQMHRLSDFIKPGRYVMVDFWASWCGPCRAEMPHVKKLYAKYHDRGFDVVGVSLDNNRAAWLKAVKQLALPWTQLSDLKGWRCEASTLYGVQAIPSTLLIGPDGKIVAADLRGEALDRMLVQLLGE